MKYLKNIMEDISRKYLDDFLKSADICGCETCRNDILAIMLNNLPSHYVCTEMGELFTALNEFDPQYRVDVTIALSEAVSRVSAFPRHDD